MLDAEPSHGRRLDRHHHRPRASSKCSSKASVRFNNATCSDAPKLATSTFDPLSHDVRSCPIDRRKVSTCTIAIPKRLYQRGPKLTRLGDRTTERTKTERSGRRANRQPAAISALRSLAAKAPTYQRVGLGDALVAVSAQDANPAVGVLHYNHRDFEKLAEVLGFVEVPLAPPGAFERPCLGRCRPGFESG
jgi:hypothetical protein